MAEVDGLKAKLQKAEGLMEQCLAEIDHVLAGVPNAPHNSVPFGAGEEDNVEVRKWGEPTTFSFEPKDHVDVAEKLQGDDPSQVWMWGGGEEGHANAVGGMKGGE